MILGKHTVFSFRKLVQCNLELVIGVIYAVKLTCSLASYLCPKITPEFCLLLKPANCWERIISSD